MDEFKSKIKDESIWKELTHLRKYSFEKDNSRFMVKWYLHIIKLVDQKSFGKQL